MEGDDGAKVDETEAHKAHKALKDEAHEAHEAHEHAPETNESKVEVVEVVGFEPVVNWEDGSVKGERSMASRASELGKKASEETKAKKKVVKRKKKLAEEGIKAEVIGCEVDVVDVEDVDLNSSPSPTMPPRMPPDLPFHFRIDVPAIKTLDPLRDDWLKTLKTKIEWEWRYCRKDQERAWVNKEELPCEIRDAAQQHGHPVDQVLQKVKERKEENWHSGSRRIFPMRVRRFETAPGRALCKEDLKGVVDEDLWCYMIYDLSEDPVLADIGHQGAGCPTVFSSLVLIYSSYLDGGSKHSTEIRVAHIDHFEFAMLFPSSPYASCKLEPADDLARCFKLDMSGEAEPAEPAEPLEALMLRARAALTWLFWDCFDALLQLREATAMETNPAGMRSAFAHTISYVRSTRRLKEFKQCERREEALASLLSLVRAQPFQFPFRITVSKHSMSAEPGSNTPELLRAVELACREAIGEFRKNMPDDLESGMLPQQWSQELQLKQKEDDGKLQDLLHQVEPISSAQPQLAVIECIGRIKLDREKQLPEDGEEGDPADDEGANAANEYEEKEMLLTVDLTKWDDAGELVVGDININDHHSIRETLAAVEQMEQLCELCEGTEAARVMEQKLAQLAYGLRALQRASMKLQLRSVGLAVLETERKVPNTSAALWAHAYQSMGRQDEAAQSLAPDTAQRVLLISSSELVLRRRAEARKLRRRVLPHKANEEFLGGFKSTQFKQKGPVQKYWVETQQSPYPYRPFFQPPEPDIDPAALLSPAERKFLVKSFITDPLSEILGPGGTVDPRQGGANMDPRQLVADGIIVEGGGLGLLHLHSQMSAIHLTNGFVYPWKYKGWQHYYLKQRCKCDTALVVHHFGPKIGSYFDFLEIYVVFLLIASVLGVIAEFSGPPNVHASGFWKFVQPAYGVGMSIWGTVFCITWRRRCGLLLHTWGNGWIEEGEDLRGPGSLASGPTRVRPEFALQWRQGFDKAHPHQQARTLRMLRNMLKAPDGSHHFDDRALTSDIMRFDEACYLSDWVQFYRFVVSYLASAGFICLASGATYGALAANALLGLSGTTAGYAVTGLTTSVLVPVLNVVHYQVVLKTNNYQLFREDSEREKDLFDRLFVFNLFNTYNSLLWIAFAERNMAQLRVQVLFLLLSSIFVNNLLEFFWSHFVKQLKKISSRSLSSSLWQTLQYLLVGEMDDGKAEPMDPIQTALEHVADEVSRDYAFELVDEAIELVIQYGLIMMFTVAFPMAPLFALVNVHIEKRLDAYKLVKLMQSPEPRMVVGMGRAFNAFVIVTGLGLLVTGLLLYFAQYDCQACTTGNCGSCGASSVELILPGFSTEQRLFLLSAGEHLLLMIMYACFTSVSLGKDIVHEQYRQRFYENRLQNAEKVNPARRTRLSTRRSGPMDEPS